MKKLKYWSMIMLMTMSLPLMFSCGGDDDDTLPPSNQKDQSSPWTITSSDEIIGTGQKIVLTTNYQTNNPNLLITWYDGETRLNSSPSSETDYLWTAGNVGVHTIKAVITDREDIIEVVKEIEVIDTDLANVILGDKKTKILRTISSYKEKNGYIEYGTTKDLNKCYFKSGDENAIATKIRNDLTTTWTTYLTTSEYYLTLLSFQNAVNKARMKYGEPITCVIPEAKNIDEGEIEGVMFYNGMKSYKAVFKLRETHRVTLTLVGQVKSSSFWSVNGEIVPMPESYTVVTEVE